MVQTIANSRQAGFLSPASAEQSIAIAAHLVPSAAGANASPGQGFSVRAFLAAWLRCEPDEIVIVVGPVGRAHVGLSASYARRPSTEPTARIVIGPGRRNLAGQVRRLVTASWYRGSGTQTDIGAEQEVDW